MDTRGIHIVDEQGMNTTSMDDRLKALENQVEMQGRMFIAKITSLEMEIAELRSQPKRQRTTATTTTTTDKGDLPAKPELDKCWLQVVHQPNIPANERNWKSEWMLYIEAFVQDQKQPQLKVHMKSPGHMLKVARKIGASQETMDAIEAIEPDCLVGIIQGSPSTGGKPYSANQFVGMKGHKTEQPFIVLSIDGEELIFDEFTPPHGDGFAKWFAKWHPSNTEDN